MFFVSAILGFFRSSCPVYSNCLQIERRPKSQPLNPYSISLAPTEIAQNPVSDVLVQSSVPEAATAFPLEFPEPPRHSGHALFPPHGGFRPEAEQKGTHGRHEASPGTAGGF